MSYEFNDFPQVFKAEAYTYAKFLLARVVFDTRCISVNGPNNRAVTSLVPWTDVHEQLPAQSSNNNFPFTK
jgi:hypothetical protein